MSRPQVLNRNEGEDDRHWGHQRRLHALGDAYWMPLLPGETARGDTRKLAKHQKDVDRFYSRLLQAGYRSEVAGYYQQRLTKYKGKLFTFLGRDGVPWNNNGENAIKGFAALRKVLGTAFSEDGIKDYV